MELFFFGDQTGLSYEFLKTSLQRTRKSPIVNAFLNGAATILRQEVGALPQADRECIPNFTSVQELIQRYSQNAGGHPAVEASLLCISQFIHFLGWVPFQLTPTFQYRVDFWEGITRILV